MVKEQLHLVVAQHIDGRCAQGQSLHERLQAVVPQRGHVDGVEEFGNLLLGQQFGAFLKGLPDELFLFVVHRRYWFFSE